MSPVRLLKAFISSAQPIALIGCLVIDEFKFLQLTFDLTVERLQNGVCPEQVRKQRNRVFFAGARLHSEGSLPAANSPKTPAASVSSFPHPAACLLLYMDK